MSPEEATVPRNGLDSNPNGRAGLAEDAAHVIYLPACGRRYRGSKIRLLAERDGLFFVDLDCARCGSHTVAIVTVEMDDGSASIMDISDLSLVD